MWNKVNLFLFGVLVGVLLVAGCCAASGAFEGAGTTAVEEAAR